MKNKLHGAVIPNVSQVIYLDFILNKRLTFGSDLKLKRKTLNSRLNLLKPILKSNLSIENKMLIY